MQETDLDRGTLNMMLCMLATPFIDMKALDKATVLAEILCAFSEAELRKLEQVLAPGDFARLKTSAAELDQKIQNAVSPEQMDKIDLRDCSDALKIETLRHMDAMLALVIKHKIADAKELSRSNRWADWTVYDVFRENNLKTLTAIAEASGANLAPPHPQPRVRKHGTSTWMRTTPRRSLMMRSSSLYF